MGNTFNDAISCLKKHIDLYTWSIYTRVYTIFETYLKRGDCNIIMNRLNFNLQQNFKPL